MNIVNNIKNNFRAKYILNHRDKYMDSDITRMLMMLERYKNYDLTLGYLQYIIEGEDYLGLSIFHGEFPDSEETYFTYGNDNRVLSMIPSMSQKDLVVPFFRIHDAFFYEDCTKIARISLLAPDYIYHSYTSKPEWYLTSKEIEELMDALHSKDNWKHMIEEYDYSLECIENHTRAMKFSRLSLDLPIPDYRKLQYDEAKHLASVQKYQDLMDRTKRKWKLQ